MGQQNKPAWIALQAHQTEHGHRHLSELFADDSGRFERFSRHHDSLLLDFSKQRIDAKTLELLCQLARECDLEKWIGELFAGAIVNNSEQRPALHSALRLPAHSELIADEKNIVDDVQSCLQRMQQMVESLRAGEWLGHSGKPIETIVNIGVGGSDLGPVMACRALADGAEIGEHPLEIVFASTMDGTQLAENLDRLNPATTLFIISSKSFTTIDTLSNADTALQWLRSTSGASDTDLFQNHFIGVSTASARMRDWGIPDGHQLPMWDWVGGRYSMWSAIGLPIALKIGMTGFRDLLAGAHAMDQHFQSASFEDNLPVLLAMMGVWNVNFLDIRSLAVLPYDGRLGHLPAYLGQLEMEINGKRAGRDGTPIEYHSCPILWGEVGPNAQHAFYQLLHQGTEPVMCDFIVPARRYQDSGNAELEAQQQLTLANCLAQSRILALGDTVLDGADSAPVYKRYRGNQPSSTILLDELTPHSLGELIALYEHKVFVQSVIWNINPFDQWGVELGKQAATGLLDSLAQDPEAADFDSSTNGLLAAIRTRQGENH